MVNVGHTSPWSWVTFGMVCNWVHLAICKSFSPCKKPTVQSDAPTYPLPCHLCSGRMVWRAGSSSLEAIFLILVWTQSPSPDFWRMGTDWTNRIMLHALRTCKKDASHTHTFLTKWYTSVYCCSNLIMSKCWYMDPNKRPTFSELVSLISQNLASLAGYLDVCTFTESETHVRKDPDGDTEVEDKMWQ